MILGDSPLSDTPLSSLPLWGLAGPNAACEADLLVVPRFLAALNAQPKYEAELNTEPEQ